MNVLFDISHPAHVHFFKNIIRELDRRGHRTSIVAREKDVTQDLLRCEGFEFSSVGRSGEKTRAAQLFELLERVRSLRRHARSFRPRLILTRNPSGVQVAHLCGAVGVFDTDDGQVASIHHSAAAPFAHWITSPDCLAENYGARHLKYPGYKQGAYLHPNHFRPDPAVRGELGLAAHERFTIVRFVDMNATHDSGERGFPDRLKEIVIERLLRHGRVFLTSEAPLPVRWRKLAFPAHPRWMHDALAQADLLVGDSQSMTAEAAVLGTPSLRISSFAGRISYLEQLEHDYGLTVAFHPGQSGPALERLERLLNVKDPRESLRHGYRRMLADKIDVAAWYIQRIEDGTFLA